MNSLEYMNNLLAEVLEKYPHATIGFISKPASGTYFVKALPSSFFNEGNEEWLDFSCQQMEKFNIMFEQDGISMSFIPSDYHDLEEYMKMTKEVSLSSSHNESHGSMIFDSNKITASITACLTMEDTSYAMAA